MNIKEEFGRDELKTMDVKHLVWWNIHPLVWDWSRGAKTIRYYTVGGTEVVTDRRVKVEWSYTMDANNREVIAASRTIDFYENDGVTSFLNAAIPKPQNSKSLGELNQDIRKGRITDLVENAKVVPGGQGLVDALYAWYGAELADYIGPDGGGVSSLETALVNETDPVRLGTLGTGIPEFGGLTVMQLLSFQLVGAYTWP